MFFQRNEKKEEMHHSEDAQDIKDAVSDDKMPEHSKEFYLPKEEPVITKPHDGTAPLFVKVDKYYDILKNVQETKMFLSGAKQLYALMAEIESMRTDALNLMKITLQKLEKNTTQIDSEFLRPGEKEFPISHETQDVQNFETSLNELQGQLNSLKKDLRSMQ
jgi:hypothetical protein